MIKFFRSIRQKLLTENKFSKYLLYAIGEIVLVVIGILIALSINNWNEKRIETARLNSVLNIVKADLIKDTLNILRPIKDYENKKVILLKIIEREKSKSSLDSITKLSFKKYEIFTKAISNYFLFNMNKRGIELLKNMSNNIDFEKDTLIASIIERHSINRVFIEEDNELMRKLQFQNEEEFEKHTWYNDWRLNKYNKAMFQYFYDDEFRRKAAKYNVYSNQYLRDLKRYRSVAKSDIKLIEERLKK
tara:strand:- start:558 stop:1298 length:741 start_codon:yes stop_codon:yes gene_type:complete